MKGGQKYLGALKATAARSQARAQEYLTGRGLKYRPFLAGNELYVWGGDLRAAQDLAAAVEVASIRASRPYSTSGQSSIITRTVVPARAAGKVPSGMMASPLARTIEVRMPEPCGPASRAV